MRRSVFLAVSFAALAAIIASASPAPAAPPAGGTVYWNAPPTAAKGSVSGSGTWVAAAGYTQVGSAVLYAVPTGGGTFSSAAGPPGTNPNKWGPLTVTNLPAGQYNIYPVMNFRDINSVVSTGVVPAVR